MSPASYPHATEEQDQPFLSTDGSADDMVVTDLLNAFRDMQAQYGRLLGREHSQRALDPTELRYLFYLRKQGDAGATAKAAGTFLGISSGAMTNLIDRTEVAGYVARKSHPTDRRSIVVTITPAGAMTVDGVAATFRDALCGAFDLAAMPTVTAVCRSVEKALSEAVARS